MKKYVIEREIAGVGSMPPIGLKEAAATSNCALATLAPRIQWLESFVTRDKTFCIYLADDQDAIRDHARLSGFPASTISEVTTIIDPTTSG